jgi:hypothetical protein
MTIRIATLNLIYENSLQNIGIEVFHFFVTYYIFESKIDFNLHNIKYINKTL